MARLRKIAALTAMLAVLALAASASAFTLSKDEGGNSLAWDLSDLPIKYWANVDDPESREAAAKVRSIVRAFESWEIASSSLVSFRYAGLTSSDTVAFDGVNLVTWVENGWTYKAETIAYTTLWVTSTGRILDADIELNGEFFDWSASADNGELDIQNVLTHEVGHFIGIGHSVETTDSTMFPIISRGEVRKRLVKPDDLDAAVFLYPISDSELSVFELPASELFDKFNFAEKLSTNYDEVGREGKVLRVAAMRLTENGDPGLAAMLTESDSLILYIYPKPGAVGEDLGLRAKDAWEIPGGTIKDFTAVDIDGDGVDEIAVLRMDDMADHALYFYDAPPDGSFEEEDARTWIARDLWRIPGESDNLAIFSLDLDGNGRREVAALTYSVEGVYVISVYTPPGRFDITRDDAAARDKAITIPFTVRGDIIDLDSMDVDGDGISEAVALIKDGYSYSIQVLPLSLPAFPEEVRKLEPIVTMSLILDEKEHPLGVTVLEDPESEKPVILVVIGKSER